MAYVKLDRPFLFTLLTSACNLSKAIIKLDLYNLYFIYHSQIWINFFQEMDFGRSIHSLLHKKKTWMQYSIIVSTFISMFLCDNYINNNIYTEAFIFVLTHRHTNSSLQNTINTWWYSFNFAQNYFIKWYNIYTSFIKAYAIDIISKLWWKCTRHIESWRPMDFVVFLYPKRYKTML